MNAESLTPKRPYIWGNRIPTLGWPWTLSNVQDDFKRLWPSEVAALWGECIWTSPDLWRCP